MADAGPLLASTQAVRRRVTVAALGSQRLMVGFRAGIAVTPAVRRFATQHPDVVVDMQRIEGDDRAPMLLDGRITMLLLFGAFIPRVVVEIIRAEPDLDPQSKSFARITPVARADSPTKASHVRSVTRRAGVELRVGKPDQARDERGRWIPRGHGMIVVAIALGVALGAGAGSAQSSLPGLIRDNSNSWIAEVSETLPSSPESAAENVFTTVVNVRAEPVGRTRAGWPWSRSASVWLRVHRS